MAKDTVKINTAQAHARYLRISPRKARLVTNLVKGMWATDAIAQLQFVHKKSSAIVTDVIKSAIANATNNFKLDKDSLMIKAITVDGGAKIKRFKPRAQGRASEIRRPLSHIHVLLEERGRTGKTRKFTMGTSKKAETAKVNAELEEHTNKQEADEKSMPMRSQVEKTSSDVKKNKVANKKRILFNRKSGV